MDQRDIFIHQLLIESGLKEKMRVLDVGCGFGDVSRVISGIVGEGGEVIGLDENTDMINLAKQKSADEKYQNIKFEICDITKEIDFGEFDFIVGRRILMYLQNPSQIIKNLSKSLKQNGKMVFQESDSIAKDFNSKFDVLYKVQNWMWNTVKSEGGDVHIGSKLYAIFSELGFEIEHIKSEFVLQTKETGSDLSWVLPMMKGRILEHNSDTKDELEHIIENNLIEKEIQISKDVYIRDTNYGICAVKKEIL